MQLSVIVPVYNMAAEGKLNYCMDSLVNQTIDDYEIIDFGRRQETGLASLTVTTG